MCLGEISGLRKDGTLSALRVQGLRGFRSLRECFGYRGVLMRNPHGEMGGTVEPPCDFQKWLLGNAVFIGIPP